MWSVVQSQVVVGCLMCRCSSCFVSSNRILPFVYTFSGILVLTSEGHPKCRDVIAMGIVTYAWWFQEPDHAHMLCLS